MLNHAYTQIMMHPSAQKGHLLMWFYWQGVRLETPCTSFCFAFQEGGLIICLDASLYSPRAKFFPFSTKPFLLVLIKKQSVWKIAKLEAAVTRIRTWVTSATTKGTNHYTITAVEHIVTLVHLFISCIKLFSLFGRLKDCRDQDSNLGYFGHNEGY